MVTKYGPMVPDAAAVLGFAVYSTLIVLGLMLLLDILQSIFLPQIKEETLENESHLTVLRKDTLPSRDWHYLKKRSGMPNVLLKKL